MTATAATTPAEKEAPVAIDEVMRAIYGFQGAVDTLAALAARLASPGGAVPPEVAAAIDDLLAAAGIPNVDDLPPEQRAMAAGAARTVFGQAADILLAPGRPVGWGHTDVAVLEGQGRASMGVPPLMAATGEFGDVRSFLDVGTGVGWLAVAAARLWPHAEIVGVDTWGPSLARARENVAASGLADRIEVRDQDVTGLDDTDRFDLTWVPSFFVAPWNLPTAFERILAATRPGGQVAVGRIDPPPDPVAAAAQRLLTTRDGGSLLGNEELVDLLTAVGWQDARPLPKKAPSPLTFVVGRKAG